MGVNLYLKGLKMSLKDEIVEKIEKIRGAKIKRSNLLGGGCINDARRIVFDDGGSLLLKVNPGAKASFSKEANGLIELAKPGVIRVPKVVEAEDDFILMEYIEGMPKGNKFYENFGRNFALLHQYLGEMYGFYENNYIGSTEQLNIASGEEKEDWISFFYHKRLFFQFKLAERNGFVTEELRNSFGRLSDKIDDILGGRNIKPSLMHGDLWSGNYMSDEKGEACIIDPAVYYGDREADLAMTRLFGGFSRSFYDSYNETFPLDAGFEERENIYKLYHILNHLNIFGRSYYQQSLSLMNYYL
jgi:protein-ribulosamine 3-kinase